MKDSRSMLLALLVACGPIAPDPDADPDTTTGATTTVDPTGAPTTAVPTTAVPTTAVPTTDPLTTTGDPTTSDPTSDPTTSDTGEEVEFDFADDPYDAYTQIDRHGAPLAGTLGIRAAAGLGFDPNADIAVRDAYNASDPSEDAAFVWITEISESVAFFHEILDQDLSDLGLTPASLDETMGQLGPILVADTIKFQRSMPNSFPNGRRLEDPVVDILLAALLIQLGPTQPLDLFVGIPLNPAANEVPFAAEFPFLAAPHEP